jgi:NAD(P)H-dependent FMN reductase/putative sterol carrier protein
MTRLFRHVPSLAVPAWIILARLTGFASDSAALAALALAAAALACVSFLETRSEASPIQKGLAAYVVAGTAFVWFWPESSRLWLGKYPVAVLYTVLLAVALLPPLLGKEVFTMYFARRTTPPAVWATDIFRTINRHLTALWAVLFAAGIASSAVPGLYGLDGFGWALLFEGLLPGALMLAIGLPANKLYPPCYQRRKGIDTTALAAAPAGPPPAAEPVPGPRTPSSLSAEEKAMDSKPTVVAVNGSPHAGVGNTALMIEMLRPALAAEGFALEVITLSEHEIGYCVGCAFCMEKGKCWIRDDHAAVVERLLSADGIVLASPVYFFHVTAQMKTFLDRSLAYGHKPRPTWKPGLAVSVSAGYGETLVSEYLASLLRVYGAFSVGRLTAIATSPDEFVGKEAVEARAADLGRDLARAIRDKRRYPVSDMDLRYWQFMGGLVRDNRGQIMKDDYAHWEKHGLFESFESYTQQKKARPAYDPEVRKAWIKELMARQKTRGRGRPEGAAEAAPPAGPQAAGSCRELLEGMPLSFRASAAQGLEAVYQFEVSGGEQFTAHLRIAGGECRFHEGPAERAGVVVRTPAEVWLAIARGELDGQSAFMAGRYTATGDIGLLLKLKSLFG